jgi:hypothetical protein
MHIKTAEHVNGMKKTAEVNAHKHARVNAQKKNF